MKRAMWISGAVALLGVVIIAFYEPTGAMPGEQVGGGHGTGIVVAGYFLAFIGAAGLIAAWVMGRRR